MAGILKQHINITIAVLLVLLVGAVYGTVVLYQRALAERTTAYTATNSSYATCSALLEAFQQNLAKTQTQLTQASTSIRLSDELYRQLEGTLAATQATLQETQKNISTISKDRDQYKDLHGKAQLEIDRLAALERQLQDNVTMYQNRINRERSDLNACEDERRIAC